jgi:c-di-GMP-binding flagellar brake protein YcgR
MATDPAASPPSPRDRRQFYRITATLPIRLQPEADHDSGGLIVKSVNLSGGGIGLVVDRLYKADEILSMTLRLADEIVFTSFLEVLRVDPLPYPGGTYRLHGRFVRMSSQDRELLVRHILQWQRTHLQNHYSA